MNVRFAQVAVSAAFALSVCGSGCQSSPNHTTDGAVVGGVTGAGVGALIGSATGHTGAGAAIGAGVGALTGAAVGNSMDAAEARNRAEIQARIGREIAGRVTIDDVVTMTHSGVTEEIIINHIQRHGMAAPLQTNDLIFLKDQGISPRVIETMQVVSTRPPGDPNAVIVGGPGPYYGGGYYYSPYYGYRPYRDGYYYRGYYR